MLAALMAGPCAASAQQAFENLSFGVEAGTVGVGVELALPVVTDHIVVKAGFNAPSLARTFRSELPMDEANATVDRINAQFAGLGIDESIAARLPDAGISVRPVLNLSTAKLMFEYYPFRKSSFHITAGAYFGMGDNFLSATVSADDAFWSEYGALAAEVDALNAEYRGTPGYVEYSLPGIRFSLGDRTFELAEQDGGASLEARLDIARVRPYLGLGFGRSVPRGNIGFQLDLGVWYHGVPALVSSSETAFDPSAVSLTGDISLLDRLVLYPQLSIRLIYKII